MAQEQACSGRLVRRANAQAPRLASRTQGSPVHEAGGARLRCAVAPGRACLWVAWSGAHSAPVGVEAGREARVLQPQAQQLGRLLFPVKQLGAIEQGVSVMKWIWGGLFWW